MPWLRRRRRARDRPAPDGGGCGLLGLCALRRLSRELQNPQALAEAAEPARWKSHRRIAPPSFASPAIRLAPTRRAEFNMAEVCSIRAACLRRSARRDRCRTRGRLGLRSAAGRTCACSRPAELGASGRHAWALQVAADLVDDFPDGVYFVDLAPIKSLLVNNAIAQTLVRDRGSQPLLERLGAELRGKRLLLLLGRSGICSTRQHISQSCAWRRDKV